MGPKHESGRVAGRQARYIIKFARARRSILGRYAVETVEHYCSRGEYRLALENLLHWCRSPYNRPIFIGKLRKLAQEMGLPEDSWGYLAEPSGHLSNLSNSIAPATAVRRENMQPVNMRRLVYTPVEALANLPPIDISADPLAVPDVLFESSLMDILVDMLHDNIGLLFYVNGALSLDIGNTYLLVARRVHNLTCSGSSEGSLGGFRLISGSAPVCGPDVMRLRIIGDRGEEITIESASMSFYALNMPGMDGPLPDYGDNDIAYITARVPTFDKTAIPLAASHRYATGMKIPSGTTQKIRPTSWRWWAPN